MLRKGTPPNHAGYGESRRKCDGACRVGSQVLRSTALAARSSLLTEKVLDADGGLPRHA